jgi:hypothetical protein
MHAVTVAAAAFQPVHAPQRVTSPHRSLSVIQSNSSAHHALSLQRAAGGQIQRVGEKRVEKTERD